MKAVGLVEVPAAVAMAGELKLITVGRDERQLQTRNHASAAFRMEGDLEQLSYGAFSADLHQRQAGERVPLQVSIEVTRRCPLECLHCYNNLPMG